MRWTVGRIGGGFRGLEGRGEGGGDEDGQLEFSGYKGNGKGRYIRHNRQRLGSDSKFLLKSDAGKDTEGHLERRNDQRPRGLQEEEEEEWEEWEWGGTHTRLRWYIVPLRLNFFSSVGISDARFTGH